VDVFVSSLPGAIPTGTEWLGEIKRQLKAADAYLALLTPASVQRQWVWFESGAAFMSDKLFVGVCASGLRKGAVPSPLSGHQLLSFDSPAECAQLFKEFGATIVDIDALWKALQAQAGAASPSATEGWVGIDHGRRFFAWNGPLDPLDDRDPIVCLPGLTDALRSAGMTPTFGNADKLQHHLAEGRLQVFLTDRVKWKRAVVNDGMQLLLVHGARETMPTAFDAARQLRQRDEERTRKALMLRPDVGVRAARDEFYRLANAVDVLVKQMTELGLPVDVARFPQEPSLRVRYANAFRVTVQWIQRYVNELDESRLVVAEWTGGDASRFIQSTIEPLDQTTFHFDVSPEGEYAWRKGESKEFFSSVRLADWCVTQLLKRATPSTT
jgi:hypothetical protein